MSGNWIKLHRSIFEHGLFANNPMSEREAWIWILSKAAWEDTRQRVGCAIVDIPRGSYLSSRKELMKVFSWTSCKKVDQFLKLLESENMIFKTVIGSGSSMRTLLSIVNYDFYQGNNRDSKGIANGSQENPKRGLQNRSFGNSVNALENIEKFADCNSENIGDGGSPKTNGTNTDIGNKGTAHFIVKEINNKYIKKTNPIGLEKKRDSNFSKNDFSSPTQLDVASEQDEQLLVPDHILDQLTIAERNFQTLGSLCYQFKNPSLDASEQKLDQSAGKSKRGTQIGAFCPDVSFALQKGLTIEEAEREAEKFRNYWLANGKTKKDWNATWRNWILSDHGLLAKKNQTVKAHGKAASDKVMESIRSNLGNFLRTNEALELKDGFLN